MLAALLRTRRDPIPRHGASSLLAAAPRSYSTHPSQYSQPYEQESSKPRMNRYSARITQPKIQGASQAMLYATGLTEEQMNLPQVGISSVWYEGNPCNMHLNKLSAEVKAGVQDAGLIGYRFNTIGVSDGISMGTEGMSYSLQSREIIADSIETVMGAQWYDGNISLPGCDKNMPGVLIAHARINRPSMIVYGGTIKPGRCGGLSRPQWVDAKKGSDALDIVSAFQAYGEFIAGRITEEQRADIIRNACPGAGACGGMYTANSMSSVIEAMGMCLPYSSSTPAEDPAKLQECREAGKAMKRLLEMNLRPSDIMTRKAFENAMVITMALGGSTNVVLHLLAISRAIGVELTLDDFQKFSDKVPLIADLKPSGKWVMEDLHEAGGTPGVLKILLSENLIHGDIMTVTGKTLAENLKPLRELKKNQEIIQSMREPIKPTGHIQILRGNLAPGGSVAKITGKEGLTFKGKARVFDAEEDMVKALREGKVGKGHVVVIRYEGPKGGPGMPEMLTPTSAIMGAGLGQDVAMLTDGRFSGGSHGFIIGHITPEAQLGGPIALVQDDDEITVDAISRVIDLHVPEAELAQRKKAWKAPPLKVTRGTLYKFIKNVNDASHGCTTDE